MVPPPDQTGKKVNLPIVYHSREAAKDTMDMILETHAAECGGVIHCYSYAKEMAKEYVDMGFYIGVGGVITFKNGRRLKETVEAIPLSRIVLETDCPYLSPEPNRGKRNDSTNLIYVAREIAAIKGISEQKVIEETEKNARKLYRLDEKQEVNMEKLSNPKETIQVLQKHEFQFKKKFGQNFFDRSACAG